MKQRKILLAGTQDHLGVWRFLKFPGTFVGCEYSGLMHKVEIETFLTSQLREHYDSADGIDVRDFVSIDHVSKDQKESLELILVKVGRNLLNRDWSWITLADILREMPNNKDRVAYMKILQVLSYSPEDELTAVEVDDETLQVWRDQQDQFPSKD